MSKKRKYIFAQFIKSYRDPVKSAELTNKFIYTYIETEYKDFDSVLDFVSYCEKNCNITFVDEQNRIFTRHVVRMVYHG